MRYTAARGGHAPGHIREALLSAVEKMEEGASVEDALGDERNLDWSDSRKAKWWSGLSAAERARWIIGQLWNCTDTYPQADTLPSVDGFEDFHGGNYAQVVRHLSQMLNAVAV